jgi:hypothetical protein
MIQLVTARVLGGAGGRSGHGAGTAVPGQVTADGPGAARVAPGADLLVQDDRVRAAGVPSFPQPGLVAVEGAGRAAGAVPDQKLLGADGAGEPADGVAGDPELGGDLAESTARGPEPVHLRVPAAGPDGDPVAAGSVRILRLAWHLAACDGGFRWCGDRCGQVLAMAGDRPLDGLAEVMPQMRPVSDLDRVRRAASPAL